jgi:RHS repeat-associated protein
MEGREITQEDYRWGYQGQYAEKDTTTGWNQFQLRMYDARFGRWLSVDPYNQFWSPFIGMGNIPNQGTDPDGGLCPGCDALVSIGMYLKNNLPTFLDPIIINGARAVGYIKPVVVATAKSVIPLLSNTKKPKGWLVNVEVVAKEQYSVYNGSLEFQYYEDISTKWQEQFIVENPSFADSRIRSNGQETKHATKDHRSKFRDNREGSITLSKGKAATSRTTKFDGYNKATGFSSVTLSPQVTLT